LRDALPDGVDEPDAPAAKPAAQRRQRGFSDTLLRERIELRLSDEAKAGALKTFFTKVKEELEYIPAQLKVLEYWQEKAVFEHDGEEHLVAAPSAGQMPRQPELAGVSDHLKIRRWSAAVPSGADVQTSGPGSQPHQHGELDHPSR